MTNVEWHVGDVNRLPWTANQFDAVLTRYSLHHFLEPAQVVREMVRVCKPGGGVVIADLVLPAAKIAAYDRMEKLRDPSHVGIIAMDKLRGLLIAAPLVELQWAGYLFELELEQLLQASFPEPGAAERVRQLFEEDIGVDNLGINVRRSGTAIHFAYPIVVAAGIKRA